MNQAQDSAATGRLVRGTRRSWSGSRLVAAALLALLPLWASAQCRIRTLTLPIRIIEQRPVTTITIDGQDIPMLVDSGAFHSFLTESTARQLGLKLRYLSRGFHIEGLTGSVEARRTVVKKLKFGGTELNDVEFAVGANEIGAGIMGILGRNFLDIADTEYDLGHGVVRLSFPNRECNDKVMAYWAGDAVVNVVPMAGLGPNDDDGALVVDARLNKLDVAALMDTGAPRSSVLKSAALRAGISESDLQDPGRTGGAGKGRVNAWRATFNAFELGGERVSPLRMKVVDVPKGPNQVWHMILGLDYFLSHRIYVSRKQRKLFITWNGGPPFADLQASGADVAQFAAAASAPVDAAALAQRGQAAAARGEYERALQDLSQAHESAPDVATVLHDRALVYLQIGQPRKALEDLDAALRMDANLHLARATRAEARFATGDRAGTLADLQALDAALPALSHLRSRMARLYAALDNAPEALRQWDLWMPSRGNDMAMVSALEGRCWLRARLKLDVPLAIEDCKRALKIDRDEPFAHGTLGWAYLRSGDLQGAIQAFDRSIELRPTWAWAHYGRALARRQAGGDLQAAQSDLSRARELDAQIDAHVQRAGFDKF